MNRSVAFSRDLLAELPIWEQKCWISPEQVALLRQQYSITKPHSAAWWQLVLSLFAILCISAGVIALFASNWAMLSREIRVMLSLAPLALAQLGLLYTLYARPDCISWRECCALVTTLAVGAAIALIGQTYHIEANFLAFQRTWLLLVLPLPYLTRSWAAAFFVAFLVHVFAFSNDMFAYQSSQAWSWEYLAYVAALLPWLLWQRQPGAGYTCQRHIWRTFAAVNGLVFAAAVLFQKVNPDFLSTWLALAAWYLATRTLGRNVMVLAFQLALAFILLFPDSMHSNYEDIFTLSPLNVTSTALFLFALCRWKHLIWWDAAFTISGIVLLVLATRQDVFGASWPWVPTLFVIVLGLWRARVALGYSLFAVNAALIWVLMALFSRFVADDSPLWLKGLVFIGAGASFFALNLHLARRPQMVPTAPGETA